MNNLVKRGSGFKRLLVSMLGGLLIVAFTIPCYAGGSWFSGVRNERQTSGGLRAMADASRDSDLAVFDVTVSLYNDPSGDEDPDNDTGAEDQTKYETIIRHWASAVCEESNLTHKLGKVRIFRNGRHANLADVVWVEKTHPKAAPSGFGTRGERITFGDMFEGGNADGTDYDLLANAEGAGYTLGHEWGHYVYGLYDEYVGSAADAPMHFPRSGDTAVADAIMNSQWNAVGGNFDWLNHSTSNNFQLQTAQGRVYGKSGWEVLIQATNVDPRDGDRAVLAARTRYSNLVGKEPTDADGWIKTELPGKQNECRDKLEIIWMEDDIEMQIVIDRSGSMDGAPMNNALTAAQRLVAIVEGGKTAMGVVSFADDVSQDQAITAIPRDDDGTVAAISGVIAGLSADGWTSMYDGAMVALNSLVAYKAANGTNASQVVFLLSDGDDNDSSATRASVIAAYAAAEIPLITFGYGAGAPGGTLRALSAGTGGMFFSSPTALAAIEDAFVAAQVAVTGSAGVRTASVLVPGSDTSRFDFEIDSSLESFSASFSYTGVIADLNTVLTGADNAEVADAVLECSEVGAETSCLLKVKASLVTAHGLGTYSLEFSNAIGDELDISVNVVGNPADGPTYDVTLASIEGNTVTYPSPILLSATVSKGDLITDINISATITDPSDIETAITMNDDGVDGDGIAGDGIYSAIVGYQEDGTHTVDVSVNNDNNSAYFAKNFSNSPNIAGTTPKPAADEMINENFSRVASLQITVEDVANNFGDDHSNMPFGTPMSADNTDLAGKIDSARDEDYFDIDTTGLSEDLTVRVSNLALDMNPELTIFMSDGFTQVATATLSEGESANGYLYITIPIAELDPMDRMIARVRHTDSSAVGGVYSISAGASIFSDITLAEKTLLLQGQQGNDNDDGDDAALGAGSSSSSGGCQLSGATSMQPNVMFLLAIYFLIWARFRFRKK